ncbi:promotilin isoform X2 [Ovis aries]|uniref:promotilin isoform X2 n=1 Tax=Ovis aries TaxID=9940 RepID=UPI001C2EF0B4|nr:promotilin isoform X2 [Ovis aries]
MLSRKATAILLVVHAAAMLASQTEGFVPIFTYGEVQRMQEKERYKGQKKSLSVQQRSEEVGPVDPAEPREEKQEVIKLTAPVEIGMRMNSRQLEKYQATLEGLLRKPSDTPLRGEGGQNLDPPNPERTQKCARLIHWVWKENIFSQTNPPPANKS